MATPLRSPIEWRGGPTEVGARLIEAVDEPGLDRLRVDVYLDAADGRTLRVPEWARRDTGQWRRWCRRVRPGRWVTVRIPTYRGYRA